MATNCTMVSAVRLATYLNFTRACRELIHSNVCGPSAKKGWTPLNKTIYYENHYTFKILKLYC